MNYRLLTITFCIIFHYSYSQNISQGAWLPYGVDPGTTNGTIIDLLYNQTKDTLYATGFFTQIQGVSANYVAYRDTGSWQPMGTSVLGGGHALEFINDTLYAAGYQFQPDSNWLFFYDNGVWNKVGKGFYLTGADASQFYSCHLFDVIEWNGNLVVCGEFDRVGEDTIFGIALWDGQNWNPMGSGLSDAMFGASINPHQLMVDSVGDLWVCGNFLKAGDSLVNGIAKWDGTEWKAIGDGFNNTVYAMIEYQNQIYVGGAFTRSGMDTVLRAAVWNGTNWTKPGFDLSRSNPNRFCFVHTIKEVGAFGGENGGLVFAGGFDEIETGSLGIQTAGNISMLSSTGNVYALDQGLNGEVEGVEFNDGTGSLIAGGLFTQAKVNPGTQLGGMSTYEIILSLNTRKASNSFRIRPNPAKEKLIISNQLANTKSLALYDLLGKKYDVNYQKVGNEIIVQTTHISPGLYILKMSDGEKQLSKKVMINK